MSDVQFWQLCWLCMAASFAVVMWRGFQIHRDRNRIIDEWAKLDGLLGKIRNHLELPGQIGFDVLPGAVEMLFKDYKRVNQKYLVMKERWQEVDAKTAETKKVFSRALKRWQKAHNTEKVPHLNELVDWLVGENSIDNRDDSEMVMGILQQVGLIVSQSQTATEKLEWIQKQLKKLAYDSKGGTA